MLEQKNQALLQTCTALTDEHAAALEQMSHTCSEAREAEARLRV